jgi:hypothetical protein
VCRNRFFSSRFYQQYAQLPARATSSYCSESANLITPTIENSKIKGAGMALRILRVFVLVVYIVAFLFVLYDFSIRVWWKLSLEVAVRLGFSVAVVFGGIVLACIVYVDGRIIDKLKDKKTKTEN